MVFFLFLFNLFLSPLKALVFLIFLPLKALAYLILFLGSFVAVFVAGVTHLIKITVAFCWSLDQRLIWLISDVIGLFRFRVVLVLTILVLYIGFVAFLLSLRRAIIRADEENGRLSISSPQNGQDVGNLFILEYHNFIHIDLDLGMSPTEPGRTALVTGGATVVFQELIDEVVTEDFFKVLRDNGFSALLIQCGIAHDMVMGKLASIENRDLRVNAFAFDSNLKEQMLKCRGEKGVNPAGVVISHAGTGTIADCWETQVAQIIVANHNLMDNHQAQFAEDQAQKHANIIQGHLGKLKEAVPKAVEAAKALGYDEMLPYEEPEFPVREENRITLIDQLVALDDE